MPAEVAVIDPQEAVNFIYRIAPQYAQAKADRVYIENFLRTKKALLMQGSGENAVAAQERYAYAHAEYLEQLDGLRVAVQEEETLKWHLIAAQARIEIWRTQSANNRGMDRAAA